MLFFIDINCSCLYVSDISKSKSIPSRRHNNCEVTAPHPLRWSSRKIQTRGAGLLISVSFLLFIIDKNIFIQSSYYIEWSDDGTMEVQTNYVHSQILSFIMIFTI